MPLDLLFEANPNKFFDRIDPATRGAGMDFQDIFFSLFRMKSEKGNPPQAAELKYSYSSAPMLKKPVNLRSKPLSKEGVAPSAEGRLRFSQFRSETVKRNKQKNPDNPVNPV